ncbi:hypothetical protein NDA12_002355 [Ustilago hordei]|nr:hypothetical protein NDA15_002050 [Ustilago hordei]KAJ1591715.1 hypothetical protein NDA12_002355 [Ustilago hordei]
MQPVGEEQEHNVWQLLPSQVFEKVESGNVIGSGLQQIPAGNVIASAILLISTESVLTAGLGKDSILVAPMLTMESIATQGLKELTKIFQPLDPELQGIHVKKPFEIKDGLWHSGSRLVIPKDATIKAAQCHYWWSNMVAWIADYVVSCPFGCPDHMVSDHSRQFISEAWKKFAEGIGVKHSLSTAYHPQTDGQTERVNQVVEQYLRMYCNFEQNDWAELLKMAEFVYNNTVHNSIGVSPFFACYGWNPKSHPDIPQHLGVNDPEQSEYLVDGKECCEYLQTQIREAQWQTVEQYNWKHKDIEFKVSNMVYINCWNWKMRQPMLKLDTRFAGPYPVQEQVGCWAYRITLLANLRVHDVFHMSMLKLAKMSSLPQQSEQPVVPSLPDEDLEFEVEALIGKCTCNRMTEYKVFWRGYPEEAASWEPVSNLNCPDLIQEYEVLGGRGN